MYSFKTQDEITIEKLSQIRDMECPNFFVTGINSNATERLAIGIAELIHDNHMLDFSGIMPYFTIKMPYYDDLRSAETFDRHLKNSISIAKDCYDEFSGIIVMKIDPDWMKYGGNEYLDMFLSDIQENNNIRYIVIASDADEEIFNRFCSYSIWVNVRSQTPCVKDCVSHFRKLANKYGFSVSVDAKARLNEILNERDESNITNIDAVEQLVRQIAFERDFEHCNDKRIDAGDVNRLYVGKKGESPRKIGFVIQRD